jgi:hypothetical protein
MCCLGGQIADFLTLRCGARPPGHRSGHAVDAQRLHPVGRGRLPVGPRHGPARCYCAHAGPSPQRGHPLAALEPADYHLGYPCSSSRSASAGPRRNHRRPPAGPGPADYHRAGAHRRAERHGRGLPPQDGPAGHGRRLIAHPQVDPAPLPWPTLFHRGTNLLATHRHVRARNTAQLARGAPAPIGLAEGAPVPVRCRGRVLHATRAALA